MTRAYIIIMKGCWNTVNNEKIKSGLQKARSPPEERDPRKYTHYDK